MLAEELSRTLAGRLQQRGLPASVCCDPLTILALLGVILAAIQLLYSCRRSAEQMHKKVRRLNWLDKWRLARLVIRQCREQPSLHRREPVVYEELVELGRELSQEELWQLVRDSRQISL